MKIARPYPPEELTSDMEERFAPDEDLRAWIVATFIDDGGPLFNPDHAHLADASLGVLWTNVPNGKAMRTVIGQAEMMPPMAMGKWQRARAIQQIEEWFGGMPTFLLTFDATWASQMDDATFCALIEHELYHCAQKVDEHGMPRFNQQGQRMFAIRGHDVEEFVGVVARYGAEAAGVTAMVDAAKRAPMIGRATIAGACGTCLRAVA